MKENERGKAIGRGNQSLVKKGKENERKGCGKEGKGKWKGRK